MDVFDRLQNFMDNHNEEVSSDQSLEDQIQQFKQSYNLSTEEISSAEKEDDESSGQEQGERVDNFSQNTGRISEDLQDMTSQIEGVEQEITEINGDEVKEKMDELRQKLDQLDN